MEIMNDATSNVLMHVNEVAVWQVTHMLWQRILVRLWSSKVIRNVRLIHCPSSAVPHFLHHLSHALWTSTKLITMHK